MKTDSIRGRPIRLNQHILFSNRRNHAEIMWIGDVHFGSPQCDVPRFLANLKYCEEHNVYVMLMGDLIDVGTRNSVGSAVYEQEMPAGMQHEQVVEWLKPLAAKSLILGSHRGNHEERVFKDTGYDISKALARELRVPFLGDACWSRFKVGNQAYNVYSLHGRTAARFDGTALLSVERISSSFFCDAIVHGHAHKAINSIVMMQMVLDRQVVEHKKHIIVSGSYLKYDRGKPLPRNQAICWKPLRASIPKQ